MTLFLTVQINLLHLGKPQQYFFSGPATEALHPPPLDLNGHKKFSIIFLELQKTIFFLSGQALTPSPPPHSATKKKRFLRLPLARVATLTRKLSENVYLLAKLNKAWKKSKEEKNPLCPERET